ncbi:MAG: rRNA synthase [Patescibacteria group bacterium]|nr:rRNA synthase [Patescibacteria group bacterium]
MDTLTFRPSLVHRIDRDTSGVILIAKTKRSLDRLLSALQNDKMDKTYATIVTNVPELPRGSIRKKLLRVENAKNEAKVRVDESGLPAVTHYETLKSKIAGKYALLQCRIETGRTHQIRVHLASIGTPVLGDRAYGEVGENSFAKRKFGISRQLLHAWKLEFPHPETGERIRVEAPLEPDMEELLKG